MAICSKNNILIASLLFFVLLLAIPSRGQPGSDGIGDTPHYFTGGQDRYPFMVESGWEAPPVPTYNVAVILAEPLNVPHDSTATTYQPCKLLPSKYYPYGRSKEYYQDLAYCVADYHRENSFGTVNLEFEIIDNNGNWFKTSKNEEDYLDSEYGFVVEVINLVGNKGINLSEKDIIIVIHSGTSSQREENKLTTGTWVPNNQPLGYPPFKIIVAEDDLVGGWAHEIGHIIGELVIPAPGSTIIPDLYRMGLSGALLEFITEEGKWDLMARGSWNEKGKNPPYMSSYTKEFLGWLNYDIHPKSAYGEYWINSLETSKLGDSVFRYNLSDDTNDESQKYYILEVRNRSLKTWDSSLPKDKALVLYYVDTKGYPEYGYASDGYPNNQHRSVSIPFFDGILTPNGDSHLDIAHLIYITALADEQPPDTYRIKSKIEKVGYSFFEDRLQGVVLDPLSQFYQRTIQYLPLYSSPLLNSINLNNDSFYNPIIKENPKDEKIQLAGFRFELERRKAFREKGMLIGEQSSQAKRREALVELSAVLAIFGLLSLLMFLKIKIISRWKSGRSKRYTQIFLKTLWAVIIIAFIIILYLYLFDLQSLVDIYEYIIGTIAIGVNLNDSEIHNNNEADSPEKQLGTPLSGPTTITEGVAGIGRFSLWLSIPFILLSLLLLWLDRKVIFRWKSEKSREKIKIIFRIVWAITLILFIVFITCLILVPILKKIEAPPPPFPKGVIPAPLLYAISPDLDLHLYCDDGKHIGMNYETGEYEIQIAEAIVSGDNQNIPEWIFIPKDITSCHFVVSSYDNQKFLEENPEIAAQLTDASDSYEIYARYIDPTTDIYTSQILLNQLINPDENIIHQAQGTTTISVTEGVVYNFSGFLPPIKTDGTGIYKQGRTLPTKFQLTDANNNYIATAIAELFVAKISDGVVGTDEIPLSTSAADTGNIFRYDAEGNQYIYNLSTDTLSVGTWQLKVVLDDGKNYTVIISIK